MTSYHSLADDYYVSMNLSTEMELSGSREAILHYFEQMQKKFPEMRNFYARDKGDFVLEADKERGSYRWCSVETRRICSGYVNPGFVRLGARPASPRAGAGAVRAVAQPARLRSARPHDGLRLHLPRQPEPVDRRSAWRLPRL